MQDFFALFGIEKKFSIDEKELEKKYFALQREYHPDRIIGKPAAERIAALNKSTEITNAYQVLRSSLRRAEYLVSRHGFRVNGENDNIKPSTELLMEVMEIREKLADAENAAEVDALGNFAEAELKKSTGVLEKYFAADDFQNAANETIRLKYLSKIMDEIKLKKRVSMPV